MSRCEKGIICSTLSTTWYLGDSTAKPRVVVIPWSRWAPFAAVGHISWLTGSTMENTGWTLMYILSAGRTKEVVPDLYVVLLSYVSKFRPKPSIAQSV